MRSDYLSKPMQGAIYRERRSFLLNEPKNACPENIDHMTSGHRSVLEDVTERNEQTTATGGEPAGDGQDTVPNMVTPGRSSNNVDSKEIDTSGWIKVRNKRRGNKILSETRSELASG